MTSAVIVSLRVEAQPHEAFDAFTGEIGAWWRPNTLFQLTPRGDGRLRFDPGEGGRLVAVFPDAGEFEVGRILVWAPGERLVLTWCQATFSTDQWTELEVRFEPVAGGTRVTVEHRGWDRLPREHVARHGFELILFQRRLGAHYSRRSARACDGDRKISPGRQDQGRRAVDLPRECPRGTRAGRP